MKKCFYLLVALMISHCALAQTPFITTWRTDSVSVGSSNATSITIPTTGTGYSYDVDWNNDGTYDDLGVTGNITHDYGTAGTYTVAIRGSFPRIYFNNGGDCKKLHSIDQWGSIVWTNMALAFASCSNMVLNATDVPNTAAVTDMSFMFRACSKLNQPLPAGFNTSNVTDMAAMFSRCTLYNQPLPASFNTANVTDMTGMFFFCFAYNQPFPAGFVPATNLSLMFNGATAFNQDISNWNTSAVTNMSNLFQGATSFNQDISNWNTAAVTSMPNMFGNATSFNQNISAWNTSAVTSMSGMFFNATSFNQNISNWNTAAVTTMQNMFNGATSFNQNVGSFNIGAVTNMSNIFLNSGISSANYDAILTAWNTAGYTNKNLGNASPLKYCSAQAARTNLTTVRGWTITGDALACLSEMNVKGNGVSIIDGDNTPSLTDHTAFGFLPDPNGTIVRTFTIENTGSDPLNLTGTPKVVIGGTNPTDFTVNVQPNSPVAATNGTTTFQVTFAPLPLDRGPLR